MCLNESSLAAREIVSLNEALAGSGDVVLVVLEVSFVGHHPDGSPLRGIPLEISFWTSASAHINEEASEKGQP